MPVRLHARIRLSRPIPRMSFQETSMRHILFAGSAALALLAPSATLAQSVDSRIGRLELQAGYPSKATAEKLFDEMDFQRATQAFIWALPAVGFHGLHQAHLRTFGAKDGDVVLYRSEERRVGKECRCRGWPEH